MIIMTRLQYEQDGFGELPNEGRKVEVVSRTLMKQIANLILKG